MVGPAIRRADDASEGSEDESAEPQELTSGRSVPRASSVTGDYDRRYQHIYAELWEDFQQGIPGATGAAPPAEEPAEPRLREGSGSRPSRPRTKRSS